MVYATMKLPKNRSCRLSDDVWLMGEALKRYRKGSSTRSGIEMAVRITIDRLAEQDADFADILKSLMSEGVEEDG